MHYIRGPEVLGDTLYRLSDRQCTLHFAKLVADDRPAPGDRACSPTLQVVTLAQLPPLCRDILGPESMLAAIYFTGASCRNVTMIDFLRNLQEAGCGRRRLYFYSIVPSSPGLCADRTCGRTAVSPAASFKVACLWQRDIMGSWMIALC